MLVDSRESDPICGKSQGTYETTEKLRSRLEGVARQSRARTFVARDREDGFRLGKSFDARRNIGHTCGDSGRRARHAVLAAKPDAHAEATAEHCGQRDDAGADRLAVAPADSRRTHLE